MKKDHYPHELIGQSVTIVQATNPTLVGAKGEIIDETKETLKIHKKGITKIVLKRTITLKLSDGKVLNGRDIAKRPEDRIKGK